MPKSKFTEKLFSGSTTEDADWVEHLSAAHRASPSMTPQVFGKYRTRDGLSSYQVLASSVRSSEGPLQILDLGCGDGHLIRHLLPRLNSQSQVVGVDMVATEIDRAKSECSDPRVRFICEMAQELSLPSESCDYVLCHMTLMLMLPTEPVVAQIRRVLKHAGIMSAIISAPRSPNELSGKLASTIFGFLKKQFPQMGTPRLGDPRFATTEGLKELFSEQIGFSPDLTVEDFHLEVHGDLDAIWNFYKDMYLVGMVPVEFRGALREEIASLLSEHMDAHGRVSFQYPMRRFEVSRSW